MKFKKFLALSLALLMLIPCLFACKKDDGNSDSTTVTTVAGETNYLDKIPVIDLQGDDFVIVSPTRSWADTRMMATEQTAEVINDALYFRTLGIKERLNVNLVDQSVGSVTGTVKSSISTGDGEFDLLLLWPSDALMFHQEGLTADQNQISTINFENPWWETNINDQINVGNRKYITFNQSNLILYSGYYLFVFNKDMVQDNKLTSPYDLVSENKWTWEAAYEMMKAVATDENLDGVSKPADDETVGFVGHINHSQNLILSSGATLTTPDANGNPVYNGLSERYINAFTKYTDYFIKNPYTAISGLSPSAFEGYTSSSGLANYINCFNEGKSLFMTTGTSEVTAIRESTLEYGIVIFPKYDTQQEDYVTPIYKAVDGFAIPSDHDEEGLNNIGIVMETLGALSMFDPNVDLVNTHIGTVLHRRTANDQTAIDMITMVYEKSAIDICLSNNFGKCADYLLSLNTLGNSSNLTSIFGRVLTVIQKDIEKAVTF